MGEGNKLLQINNKVIFSPTIAIAVYIDEADLCLKKEVMLEGKIKN